MVVVVVVVNQALALVATPGRMPRAGTPCAYYSINGLDSFAGQGHTQGHTQGVAALTTPQLYMMSNLFGGFTVKRPES